MTGEGERAWERWAEAERRCASPREAFLAGYEAARREVAEPPDDPDAPDVRQQEER